MTEASASASPESSGHPRKDRHYSRSQWEDVERQELEYLFPEHDAKARGRPRLTGLAFSGGGIRSASFGLGVLQALVAGKSLPTFGYLSTVSGGGYLGYKLAHEKFPDETTADQFFNEARFEACRELGYHIGWQLLESEPGRRLLGEGVELDRPAQE